MCKFYSRLFLCYNKSMSKNSKNVKNPKPANKQLSKNANADDIKIAQKRRALITVLVVSVIFVLLSLLVNRRITLLSAPIMLFVVGLCLVGNSGLNKSKKYDNYGMISVFNGATVLFIFSCYIFSYAPNCTIVCSDLYSLALMWFYLTFLPVSILFAVMSCVGIYHHKESLHPTRTIVLNIIGIALSVLAFLFPVLLCTLSS